MTKIWATFPTWLKLFFLTLVAGLCYLVARVGIGAYFMYQADQAGHKNLMVKMYEHQQNALVFNPYFASYHRRYALTNLALATALTNKTDLTNQEQLQVPTLIQQAVREAQAATRLGPKNPLNWQIQGQIYANLIGTTNQADQWAIQAYLEAIKLDPQNPELLFNLSKILYQTNNFQEAQKLLTQTIELQPTHAQAYYYLANTHQKQLQYPQAISTYEQLLNLVEPGSKDYQTALEELNQVKTEFVTREATPSASPKETK